MVLVGTLLFVADHGVIGKRFRSGKKLADHQGISAILHRIFQTPDPFVILAQLDFALAVLDRDRVHLVAIEDHHLARALLRFPTAELPAFVELDEREKPTGEDEEKERVL